jgi:hypothetical protein
MIGQPMFRRGAFLWGICILGTTIRYSDLIFFLHHLLHLLSGHGRLCPTNWQPMRRCGLSCLPGPARFLFQSKSQNFDLLHPPLTLGFAVVQTEHDTKRWRSTWPIWVLHRLLAPHQKWACNGGRGIRQGTSSLYCLWLRVQCYNTKYPGRVFKLPLGNRWIVIVNGREVLEQLRKARDDEVSVTDAGNDVSTWCRCLGSRFR